MSSENRSCPMVCGVFVGKEVSGDFSVGAEYALALFPDKDGALRVCAYPFSDESCRVYSSFGSFTKDWEFKSFGEQCAALLSADDGDAKKLFQENKALASKNASLQDELNLLRAKYSGALDAAEEKEQVYAQDRDNMSKVSQDLNRKIQELTKQLQTALDDKNKVQEDARSLFKQLDEMRDKCFKLMEQRDNLVSESEKGFETIQRLSAQGSTLSKAVENLTTLLLRRDSQ